MSAARLQGIATGVAPVTAGLFLMSLVLGAVLGLVPAAITRAELVDPDERFDISARANEVMTVRHPGGKEAQPRVLVVAVGLSTAREALSPQAFDAASPPDHQLLNLAYAGGSFQDMLAYYSPVLRRLRPGTPLLLAVHPSWLAGRALRQAAPPFEELLRAAAPLTPRRLMGVLYTWLHNHTWLSANRQGMHYMLRGAVLGLRENWLQAIGITPTAWRINTPSSPFDVRHLYQTERADNRQLETQLAHWKGFGWFDESRYRSESVQAQSWLQLLQETVESRACIIVVLMPEALPLRTQVPPHAAALLLQLQARAAPQARVLDLRSSLPEDRFHDHAHLNPRGRAEFSAKLPAMLAAPLGSCPDAGGR